MKIKLTDKTVAAAQCPPGKKDKIFADDTLPGFILRVTSRGSRIFLFKYNVGKERRRPVLGTWGTELTTAQARRKAEMLRGQVRDQRDPVAERKAASAAAIKAEAQAKVAAAAAAYTVETLIADWTAHHLCARSASYAKRAPTELRAALKEWLVSPADAFGRTDAVRALDAAKILNGPVAANRLRAEARSCWTWAVKRGALAVNPWEATPRPLAREKPRERVLSDAEVGAVYNAAAKVNEPWDVLARILVLTGQRRGEVAGMQWSELDLDAGVWSMSGERTKNHHSHVVPLAPDVVVLLRTVKRRKGAELVFEGPRQTAFSGFGKLKDRLDAAIVEAGISLAPWTMHDLRRTMATGLQRLGVRLEVTEAILNHVSGSRSGIVGVYQRHGWEREKVEAMRAWAARVLASAEGKPIEDNDGSSSGPQA
jgi:integrase